MAEKKKRSKKTIVEAANTYLQKIKVIELFGFSEELHLDLKESLGLSHSPLDSMRSDDDWAFVIKMHAFLEVALNHLLLSELANPKLTELLSKLPTGEGRFGKLSLIRAYDLLPSNACIFVEALSSVRNNAVHGVDNLGLNLPKYVTDLKPTRLKAWRDGMSCWNNIQAAREMSVLHPRIAIFCCCVSIMARAVAHGLKCKARDDFRREMTLSRVEANPKK